MCSQMSVADLDTKAKELQASLELLEREISAINYYKEFKRSGTDAGKILLTCICESLKP